MENTNTEVKQLQKIASENEYYTKTILQQIQYPYRDVFWSWGGHKFQQAQTIEKYPKPTLIFQVSGMKFVGEVRIYYNWLDYYEIEFIKDNKVVQRYDEIYCDMLQNTIDEFVEKLPHYEH